MGAGVVDAPAVAGCASVEYVTTICRVEELGFRMLMLISPAPTPSFCRDSESAEDSCDSKLGAASLVGLAAVLRDCVSARAVIVREVGLTCKA